MSEREQAKQIIDTLPDYKMSGYFDVPARRRV